MKSQLKAVQFISYFFLNAIIYGILIYMSDIHKEFISVILNAITFGILMAIFQVFIISKMYKNKDKKK